MKIAQITAFEVLDSRGRPTINARVFLKNGLSASALVPSGASTGSHEALELRDNNPQRFLGKGVLRAVANIREKIAPALKGFSVTDQEKIDRIMISLDGTANKNILGANAILAVSMACARLGAKANKEPLWLYLSRLAGLNPKKIIMPLPLVNILNGGKHAAGSTDIQEYLILAVGAADFPQAIRWSAEVFAHLGKILSQQGFQTTVGDEGGYAPPLKSNETPFKLILKAIRQAGLVPGREIALGIDAAATEFFTEGRYHLKTDNRILTTAELVTLYQKWARKYPLVSLEDHFAEDDWEGFRSLNQKMGQKIQNIGDDLYVTNTKRLEKGIKEKATNSILIKLNQIGSVSETLAAVALARKAGLTAVISHRSGETEDTFIADLAVGLGTGQIKTGSLSRSERIAKYNRLLEIENQNQGQTRLARFPFGGLRDKNGQK
ncbi:MAG: phosphopyruvate hydratase [Candidatus Pacebacteria bacterium]|nr:phosphopyruvate hydratase [Candidatus Paceibacterota bacterium]